MRRILTILTTAVMLIALLAGEAGCKRTPASVADTIPLYKPCYARNFELYTSADTSTVTLRRTAADTAVVKVKIGAGRIVCMSSTQIAMLDALGATDLIVGVSGLPYIANAAVHRNGVVDLGPMENVDYEALVALKPDLVLLYGIDGVSPMEARLNQLGIPYCYVQEFAEAHPLGKAEWIVPLGYMIGRGPQAEQVFDSIARAYHSLAESQQTTGGYRPTVMFNTPYNGVWYQPASQGYMATLVADAGLNYCFGGVQKDPASVRILDLEEAYVMADTTSVWLNVDLESLAELRSALPKFGSTPAVVQHHVWASNAKATEAGGNDFYERGTIRPDLVLADLIAIRLDAAPASTYTPASDTLNFYRRLK